MNAAHPLQSSPGEPLEIRGHRVEPREIGAQLLQCPQVKRAAVLACEDEAGERQLTAYVLVDLEKCRTQEPDSRSAPAQITDRWQKLYDLTYSAGAAAPDFAGWNSSYTRRPIPEEEMQEWLQDTVTRIRALRPRKVLEIGCGSGLLLQHLAPECSAYVGIDFAPAAVERLRQWILSQGNLQHVRLLRRSALELEDLPGGSFDTVVLNSVVQYFPNVEYLLAVLEQAARLLAPGGRIFVGDVRHLGLLPMFHSAVQLSRAPDALSMAHLRLRIARALAQEMELAVAPQFFLALTTHLPGIAAADVLLKCGRISNEMTRYRYDVVLHAGKEFSPDAHFETRPWSADPAFLAQVESTLKDRSPMALRLISIPNPRLAREAAAKRLIETSDARVPSAFVRRQLDELRYHEVDWEPWREWGQTYGYDLAVGWGSAESPEDVEVQLIDRARIEQIPQGPPDSLRPWPEYANNPFENGIRQRLIPQLREHLRTRLPEYMIPAIWMLS